MTAPADDAREVLARLYDPTIGLTGFADVPCSPTSKIGKALAFADRAIAAGWTRHASAPEPGDALREALEVTGCRDAADLIDMANVGRSLMGAIGSLITQPGPFHNWAPAEDPAEIVLDLVNHYEDAARSAKPGATSPSAGEALTDNDIALLRAIVGDERGRAADRRGSVGLAYQRQLLELYGRLRSPSALATPAAGEQGGAG